MAKDRHVFTVVRRRTTEDAHANSVKSLDEAYPDGNPIIVIANSDDSLWGSDPALLYQLLEDAQNE